MRMCFENWTQLLSCLLRFAPLRPYSAWHHRKYLKCRCRVQYLRFMIAGSWIHEAKNESMQKIRLELWKKEDFASPAHAKFWNLVNRSCAQIASRLIWQLRTTKKTRKLQRIRRLSWLPIRSPLNLIWCFGDGQDLNRFLKSKRGSWQHSSSCFRSLLWCGMTNLGILFSIFSSCKWSLRSEVLASWLIYFRVTHHPIFQTPSQGCMHTLQTLELFPLYPTVIIELLANLLYMHRMELLNSSNFTLRHIPSDRREGGFTKPHIKENICCRHGNERFEQICYFEMTCNCKSSCMDAILMGTG